MIRLDMSEYMERHTVSKLIGSPPGYVGYNEGGQLTEAVRRRPTRWCSLTKLKRLTRCIQHVAANFGRWTADGCEGRTVDFKNTLLILTSNIGSKVIEKVAAVWALSYLKT
jgi:ATP-dependent Clp protease ATP-binding subunit ClpC